MSVYRSNSHCKYLLQFHLILVCKYRKKLLIKQNIINDVWKFSIEYFHNHDIWFHAINTDKDHIHYMIETKPTTNLSNMIKGLKSYTTYHLWQNHSDYLSLNFWKEHTFWSDGYFLTTIGEVSEEGLKYYIENQGKKVQ